ncbi:ATP-dependent nuclease [Vibrio campbellii]|uniref:ATP-dependent nuclease n=1 Tax=Vibrio campbellii TaxID=680 RepID=UPI004056F647
MRLHSITINNFRKLKDCTITFKDTTFLIGSNNAGKSSVFAALNSLHGDKAMQREDFSKSYDEEREDYTYEKEISIIAEYQDVSPETEQMRGFKGRVVDTEDTMVGETGRSIFYKKVWTLDATKPKFYLKEYPRTVKAEYSALDKVKDLVCDAIPEERLLEVFTAKEFDKKLNAAAISKKLFELDEYWDISSNEEANWVENPGGIAGNVLKGLPKVVIIPAESCVTELTTKGGALQTTLEELFTSVREKSPHYAEAQILLNKLAEELNPNDIETDFGKLMRDLNEMVTTLFPDSAVHVSADLNQPDKVIKPEFNVELESNVRTSVGYQGHGMIRATAFQLLRFVRDFFNKNAQTKRHTIFCFEEPELFLHPAAANQMRDALYDLAGEHCQIVATTHSPYMVNLGTDKSVSLTKFKLEDTFSTTNTFNLTGAFEALQGDEKQNLKMLLKVDDYISRMFFTNKSIFVEGDTEEVVVRETIKRLEKTDKAQVIGNCEFLRARGKAVMISLGKYLNALDINYIFMHDRDKGTAKAESINQPILEVTGEERRVMINECIEDLLGYQAPSYEKPYTAFKFIDENWGDKFDQLPQDWTNIFIKLCSPYIDNLKP